MDNTQTDILEQARAIVDTITDVKAEDIVLLDLRDITLIADFFVICTGNSDRQLKAIVNRVRDAVREKFGKKPWRVEGDPSGGWVLVDYGDIVIHAFTEDQRDYYDLEELWRDGKVLLRIQ